VLSAGTIVAQATASGRSPRAVVRLSGPETLGALTHILEIPIDAPGASGAHRVAVRLGDRSLACLVLVFAHGRSYTGELSAEIQLPGNPHLVGRVIGLLLEHEPVRPANPGEFTARAYLNGRLTAAQAEGVMATIAARSDAELLAASRLLSGETGARYCELADELADCLALVESGIDFVEEENVVPISRSALAGRLRALAEKISALLGPAGAREAGDGDVRVVLAGRANAGKSTLFNALLGRERAVVSARAGTTRDAIEEPLELGPREPGVILVDIAGLDEALAESGAIDASAQALARRCIARADVLIHCDPSGWFDPLGITAERSVRIRVRTKGDLVHAGGSSDLSVCALDGSNIGALKRAIADACAGGGAGSGAGEMLALVPRHRRSLGAAADWLGLALERLDAETGEQILDAELVAGALRGTLDELAELAGEITPDDVLGRIFASFCVGK